MATAPPPRRYQPQDSYTRRQYGREELYRQPSAPSYEYDYIDPPLTASSSTATYALPPPMHRRAPSLHRANSRSTAKRPTTRLVQRQTSYRVKAGQSSRSYDQPRSSGQPKLLQRTSSQSAKGQGDEGREGYAYASHHRSGSGNVNAQAFQRRRQRNSFGNGNENGNGNGHGEFSRHGNGNGNGHAYGYSDDADGDGYVDEEVVIVDEIPGIPVHIHVYSADQFWQGWYRVNQERHDGADIRNRGDLDRPARM